MQWLFDPSLLDQGYKSAFPPLSWPNPKILILGSMPGEESLRKHEYYGHPRNYFRSIMFGLLGREFRPDYEAKQQLIYDHPIVLRDTLAACMRDGSLDSNIKNGVVNDFSGFWPQYPDLKAVFFNGKTAYKLFMAWVFPKPDLPLIQLPSTSPAHQSITLAQREEERRRILEFL